MPNKGILIVFAVCLLAAWFSLVERQGFWEKILILIIIPLLYIGFRLMTGETFSQIIFPFQQFFSR